jgi:hypothetical protein
MILDRFITMLQKCRRRVVPFAFPAALAVLAFRCAREPTQPSADFGQIRIGDTWAYREIEVKKGERQSEEIPELDSTVSYASLSCARDTVLMDKRFFIISYTLYYCMDFYVDTSICEQYVHVSDSEIMAVEPKGNKTSIFPMILYKCSAVDTPKYDSATQYDTALYHDIYYPFLYPIPESNAWFFRPMNDPTGNAPMVRRYLGKETITVPGGTFETWKFDFDYSTWCIGDTSPCAIEWIACTTWISSIGNVRTSGTIENDNFGFVVSTMLSEYLSSELPSDAVKPMISKTSMDSIAEIVDANWEYPLFQEWCYHLLFGLPSGYSLYSFSLSNGVEGIEDFFSTVWGASPDITTTEAIAMLDEKPFPQSPVEFANHGKFLSIVLRYPCLSHGWKDCMYTGALEECESAIRDELVAAVYGE